MAAMPNEALGRTWKSIAPVNLNSLGSNGAPWHHVLLVTHRQWRRMSEPQGNKRLQYMALGLLSLSAIGFTAILSVFPDTPFQRYFGGINPLLVVALMTVAGVVSLGVLHTRGWFSIVSPGTVRNSVCEALNKRG